MKKIIALATALMGMAVLAWAQEPIADRKNYCDLIGNRLLYLGTYDRCFDFVEGLGRVMVNGNWGFINRSGEVEKTPRYRVADDQQSLAGIDIVLMGKAYSGTLGRQN